ncbi:MAG: hypothetical protein DRP42_06745, partial [Tenericutes bacterium]
ENSQGYWDKTYYNPQGNKIYSLDSNDVWERVTYDETGMLILYNETSHFWWEENYWNYEEKILNHSNYGFYDSPEEFRYGGKGDKGLEGILNE